MLAQDPVTGQLYEVPDNQPYGTGYAEAPTMMYDGLGNPVGWAFLAPLAAKLAAKALPVVAKYAAPLAKRFLPAITRAAGGIAPRFAQQAAQTAWARRPSVPRAFAPRVQPVPVQPVLPVEPVPYMPAPMPPSTEGEYGPIEEQYGQYAPPGPMQMPPPAPMALPTQLMPRQFPFTRPRPRPYCRAPQPVGWITPALPYTGARPRRLYLRCSVWPGPKGLVPTMATQPGAPAPVQPPMAPAVAAGMVRGHRGRRGRRGRR